MNYTEAKTIFLFKEVAHSGRDFFFFFKVNNGKKREGKHKKKKKEILLVLGHSFGLQGDQISQS